MTAAILWGIFAPMYALAIGYIRGRVSVLREQVDP